MKKKIFFLNLRLADITKGLLVCNRHWGHIRLFLVILVIWAYMWIGNVLFGLNQALEAAESLQIYLPILSIIPAPLFAIPIVLFYPVAGVKYLIIPIGMLIYSLLVSSRYVCEIHSFKKISEGMYYLSASLFALFLPEEQIEDGGFKAGGKNISWIKSNREGPGLLSIRQNSAVIIENLESPSGFLTNGRNYVSRFDRVVDIIDLRDKMVRVPHMKVMTSDRVILEVNNFFVWYRIYTPVGENRKINNQPFSSQSPDTESLRLLHYNRLISKEEKMSWDEIVILTCKKMISDFINMNDYETITSLNEEKYFNEKSIQTLLDSNQSREVFRVIGTQIIRHDFIELRISDDYKYDPKLNIWEDKWKGKAMASQTEGEAKKLAFQELAMPDIKIEFLNELVAGINDLNLEDKSQDNLILVLTRVKDIASKLYSSTT